MPPTALSSEVLSTSINLTTVTKILGNDHLRNTKFRVNCPRLWLTSSDKLPVQIPRRLTSSSAAGFDRPRRPYSRTFQATASASLRQPNKQLSFWNRKKASESSSFFCTIPSSRCGRLRRTWTVHRNRSNSRSCTESFPDGAAASKAGDLTPCTSPCSDTVRNMFGEVMTACGNELFARKNCHWVFGEESTGSSRGCVSTEAIPRL